MSSIDITQNIEGTVPFEPLLDTAQAAELLHMHPKSLQRKVRSGEIPAYRTGKRWFFRASELDMWLRSRLHSSSHLCRRKGKV